MKARQSHIFPKAVDGHYVEPAWCYRSCRSDRAARVAAVLIQIAITVPRQQRQQQFENYLREEFADERRQAIADRELADA